MSDIYYIFDEFTLELAKDFVIWLNSHNRSEPKELVVFINSIGGDDFALQSMLDAMYISSHTIHTVGTGTIQSCGFEFFIAGDRRILFDKCLCMVHQFSWESTGKYHELNAMAKQIELNYDLQIAHLSKHSNLSKAQVKSKLLSKTDIYLTAQQMIKYGLADEIKYTKKRRVR